MASRQARSFLLTSQLNSSYEEVYKIRGANGLVIDMREFHITRDNTALLTVSNVTQADLQSVDGPEEGWILDGTFQEIDIETGELRFQWQASRHFDFSEANRGLDETGGTADNPWNFFHITSVDKDGNGNYLVSSSIMNCLAYIDGQSGDVIWKLGGKNNTFEDLSDGDATNFNGPYHARFADDGKAVTLFDPAESASRGLYLDLNTEENTVQVRYQYRNPSDIATESGGSMQRLDSGNVLVSYGTSAAWTEYTEDGAPLCEVHFGAQWHFNDHSIASYRVSKNPWVGQPKTQPSLALRGYEAIVSWNGATEVVTWVLEGSNTVPVSGDVHADDKFSLVAAQFKDGFETVLSIPPETSASILRVLAVDRDGKTLTSSVPVAWNPTPQEMDAAGAINPARIWRLVLFFFVGFLSAAALGVIIWVVRRRLSRRAVRLEPSAEEYERARGGWKPADPEYNGDEHLSDDEVGLLLGDEEAKIPSRRSSESVERKSMDP